VLTQAIMPNFDRARINNDAALAFVRDIAGLLYPRPWKNAARQLKLQKLTVIKNPHHLKITTLHSVKHTHHGLRTEINIDHQDLQFSCSMTPKRNLVRFGMQLTLPNQFNYLSWYGRGPHENYCDRKKGAAIGLYQGNVDELIHHYMRPQENGNRCDIRFASLKNNHQQGIYIETLDQNKLSMSLWPWSQDDLDKAEHIHELPQRDFVTLNIDHKQQGVGGDMPGLLNLKEPYKIKKGQALSYAFRISPLL